VRSRILLFVLNPCTYRHAKLCATAVAVGYQPEPIPAAPIYFPTWANKDLRLGAPEECALRPPADAKADASDMQKWIPEALLTAEPAILTKLRETGVPPAPPASTLTGMLACRHGARFACIVRGGGCDV
jgi:hypothetical protein